ncbi:MAG: glutaredoxin [Myxococcota bacterium]
MKIDQVRFRLNDLLASDARDGAFPWRLARRVALAANDLLGEPICSRVELERRRGGSRSGAAAGSPSAAREAGCITPSEGTPPVFLYVTWDSADRAPIEQLLAARGIAYRVLDVGRDEAMLSFVRRATGGEPPAVFVGDHAVGGLEALKRADATGELARLVGPRQP